MNAKALFILLGIVVVAGGFFAVQSLQTKVDIDEPSEQVARSEEDDSESAAAAATDDDDSAQVSTISDRTRAKRRPLSSRPIKRGAGAAALDVTPATGTPVATRPPNSTPTPEEVRQENRSIADLTNMFKNTSDPDAKIDIADELGAIDSPEAIKSVLDLLRNEQDASVQTALLEAMQGLDAQEEMADEIFNAVTDIYTSTDDSDVKIAAQDLMGDLANEKAAAGLKTVVAGDSDPSVKANAAKNLLQISKGDPKIVTKEDAAIYNGELKKQFGAAKDAVVRQQIIMALAVEGKDNLEFFQEALKTEQDAQNKKLLERLVTIYTSPAPQAPPPGTVVTPVPTP